MLSQNQTNLDAVIGDANYDIGHVFSTGGGGVASLAVPCRTGSKARGVTGLSSPIGDVFYIDFVAHEMGHQWGGNHSFNGNAGNCSGGNRNAGTAYEPGSGSTIMAYAGICGNQDLQSNSDDYFHTISFEEIVEYSALGIGDTCAQPVATGNNPPVVEAGPEFTIPLATPFELCGAAVDPDGGALTFGWEEFDLGPPGHPDFPIGDAPVFRSFQPTTSPCRTFPKLSDLVDGTQTLGELLPTYARNLTFRLTARDNRPGGGGVDFDSTALVVVDSGGPFRVTAPNAPVTIPADSEQTIRWDPAGTDLAPIDCDAVDILLSTNRGSDYLFELAAETPNDGAEAVTFPDAPTESGRLKVRCSDNVFFDINDADLTIETTTDTKLALDGDCPGPVTMRVADVSPNASVAVVWSTDVGTTVVPSGPCEGAVLDLDEARIGRFISVDGDGGAEITVDVDTPACGRIVQLVDMEDCSVSNLSGLQ